MIRYILLFALIPSIGLSNAAPSDPKPGKYVLDHGSGTLDIRRGAPNKLTFEIQVVGGNCHTCAVSGVIRNTIGSTEEEPALRCDITFESDGSALVVRPITEDACRSYCGMRASFEGKFRVPPASCTTLGRQAQRDKFLLLYRAHRYAEAANILGALTSVRRLYELD